MGIPSCKRNARFLAGMWTSYLYFNAKLTDSNGEEIPVHDAIHHFFTSPWWVDLWQSLNDVWVFAQHHGWYETWRQIVDLSDPHGEINAYKVNVAKRELAVEKKMLLQVLGVGNSASQVEITQAYRKLSREFHPDKVREAANYQEAQAKFMEIQQAYEILSNSKARRRSRSSKSA